jgi:hypothetical protein
LLAQGYRPAQSPTEAAIASANGSGTLPKEIRIAIPGPDAAVSTLLSRGQRPPAWLQRLILEEIPAKDDYGLLTLDALIRFARTCALFPDSLPKPYYGVGDDATIGAEWDLGRYHVEIQVGVDPAVDSILFEVDGGQPEEFPLEGNVRVLAEAMSRILAD